MLTNRTRGFKRLQVCLVFIFLVLACCFLGRAQRHVASVEFQTLLSKSCAAVICKSKPLLKPDGLCDPIFIPVKSIADYKRVRKWVDLLNDAPKVTEFPAIGHLCHVVFLDKNGAALVMASVICHKSAVSLERCHKRRGGFFVEIPEDFTPARDLQIVCSEPFVRDVYGYMKTHMSEELRNIRESYSQIGQNLDDLLFERKNEKPPIQTNISKDSAR